VVSSARLVLETVGMTSAHAKSSPRIIRIGLADQLQCQGLPAVREVNSRETDVSDKRLSP